MRSDRPVEVTKSNLVTGRKPVAEKTGRVVTEVVPIEAFARHRLDNWRALADRSIEANAFLHPDFVLPSLGTADQPQDVVVVAVSEADGALRAVGVFDDVPATVRAPVRHLRAYRTRYSFLSGFLFAPERPAVTADAVIGLLTRPHRVWGALQMSEWRIGRPTAAYLLEAAERAGVRWLEHARYERATLTVGGARPEDPVAHLGRSRRKSIRRARRRLEALGRVRWRYVETADPSDYVERFLDLEHLGWKGEEGTSMRSRPQDERFFREMMERFSERESAFFTELLLDDRVVASTCNLRIGGEGFAFKVAYDPEFRDMSPGLLNEIEFLGRHEPSSTLSRVDSGAPAGAFIDELWPGREPVVEGCFIHGARAALGFGVPHVLRRAKRAAVSSGPKDA